MTYFLDIFISFFPFSLQTFKFPSSKIRCFFVLQSFVSSFYVSLGGYKAGRLLYSYSWCNIQFRNAHRLK